MARHECLVELTAEHLVVRRDDERLAAWNHPHLHARTADLAGDELLRDPPVGELLEVGRAQATQTNAKSRRLLRTARRGQIAQRDDSVPVAGYCVVVLNDGSFKFGLTVTQRNEGVGQLRTAAHPVDSRRV